MQFEDLKIKPEILKATAEMGFVEPSPVQEKVIPAMRQGADVIAQARTGTGKTAAFGIPILEALAPERKPQALVLVPTRELAVQVCEEITEIGKYVDAHILPIYGGTDMNRQVRQIHEGVQIIVGTPGRIMDHMRRGTLRIDTVKTVILDEADRMLDMGFIDDIDWILSHTQKNRQTSLFSATIPDEIKNLTARYMRNAVHFNISEDVLTVPECRQYYTGCLRGQKYGILMALLRKENPKLAIIFCSTKRMADILERRLHEDHFRAMSLHGNLTQSRRDHVMAQFREGKVQLLIATDLAARGIDVEGITHIINYDIPRDAELYVHRIGRTARMGKSGAAFTIVTNEDNNFLRSVQRLTSNALQWVDIQSAFRPRGPSRGGPVHARPERPEHKREEPREQKREEPATRGPLSGMFPARRRGYF
jgi:ATP-dependent RNA helicase DeaD